MRISEWARWSVVIAVGSVCFGSLVLHAGAAARRPFVDVTEEAGLAGLPNLATAWGDFDNDGWVDLYVKDALWRNEEGKRFVRMVGEAPRGEMGLWGDFDNDGRLDLYCCGNGMLFRNIDGSSFEDVSAKLPERPMELSRGGAWGDFDGDGDLDLYVGGYETKRSQPDAIFRNNGDGTFEEAWRTSGRIRPARGVTTADFDLDGDLDIYVSNYRLQQNLLLRNRGDGTFDELAVEYAVAGDYGPLQAWGHTIGSAFGDFDNDGFLDLFVGNFSHPAAYQDRPEFLRNPGPSGGFRFENKSANAGLAWQESFASPTLGDYDNDGLLDLFFTTVYGGDHSVLYRNNGDWTFTDVTEVSGVGTVRTYQSAWADYDNDGDLDLASGGKLYRNPGDGGHWLKLRLKGGGKVNRSAIGAQAWIRLGDRTLTRQVEGAVGEGNQNDPTLHFGLGTHDTPVDVEILWPGGDQEKLRTDIDCTATVTYTPSRVNASPTLSERKTFLSTVNAERAPDWICVTRDAGWQPRNSQGEFIYKDNFWVLGGWLAAKAPNPRDVWKSSDGKQWTRVVEVAPWEHSDLSVALVFRDKMWFMGGRKLPGTENSNKVWSSSDGADWALESDDPGWCPRVSPSFAVFKDRMWVFAGTENYYDDNDDTLKNDVWSSADGKEWKLEAENAGWPKRTHAQATVFDDKIWIMGGGRWKPVNVPLNDVWCSADGVNWTQVTDAAPWKPRMWFSLVVYRDRMWVLGGWSAKNGSFNDVWHSKDGKDWTELKSGLSWTKRHEHSAYVFRDKIWLAGGYANALESDVWTLELPQEWSGDQ